jgi:hypothetical protein
VGPHNLLITDDNYRKLVGLDRVEEQDASVPTIAEEV